MPIDKAPLYHDESTIRKVFDALTEIGLGEQEALDGINSMQNKGILFRESVPEPEEYGD